MVAFIVVGFMVAVDVLCFVVVDFEVTTEDGPSVCGSMLLDGRPGCVVTGCLVVDNIQTGQQFPGKTCCSKTF